MNRETHLTLVNQKTSEKPDYKLRRKVVALLAGATVLGGAYAIDRGEDFLKNNAHTNTETNDFSKYGLANPNDLAFYTVRGEQSAEEVAKDMGIYNWAEVGDSIISAQVNDPNSKDRWTMHAGQVVVLPKDMTSK